MLLLVVLLLLTLAVMVCGSTWRMFGYSGIGRNRVLPSNNNYGEEDDDDDDVGHSDDEGDGDDRRGDDDGGHGDDHAGWMNPRSFPKLWVYPMGSVLTEPAIGIDDGTVYVVSSDGNLYALEAASGLLKWKYFFGGNSWSSPALLPDGKIVFGTHSGSLHCVDFDGQLIWTYRGGSSPIYSAPTLSRDNSIVYYSGLDSFIHLVNASNGNPVAKFAVPYSGQMKTSVSISSLDDSLLFGSYQAPNPGNYIYSFHPNGTLNYVKGHSFDCDIENSVSFSTSGGSYFYGCGSSFYCRDLTSGEIRWTISLPASISQGGTAVHPSGIIFFATWSSNAFLYALDEATGEILWSFPTDDYFGSRSAPSIRGDVVFFAVRSPGIVFGLDVFTGVVLYEGMCGTSIEWASAALSSDGTIYIGSNSQLCAFRI
jgi:outer membrane protein assembly factor BamB